MAPGKKTVSTSDSTSSVSTPVKRASAAPREMNSPLKRLKAARQMRRLARAAREEVTLSTVEEYRAHVMDNEATGGVNPDVDVIVRGMVLWASQHTYGDRRLIRLHVTDAAPVEELEELMEFKKTHELSDEDRMDVDELLLTVTIFGETLESAKIPEVDAVIRMPHTKKRVVFDTKIPEVGAVIRMPHTKKRVVFDSRFCQLVTRLVDIIVE